MTEEELKQFDLGALAEQTRQNASQLGRLTTTVEGMEGRFTAAVQASENRMEVSVKSMQAELKSEIKGIATSSAPNLNSVWRVITFCFMSAGTIGAFLFGLAQWQIIQMRSDYDFKVSAARVEFQAKLDALDKICVERNAVHEKHLDKIDDLLTHENSRKLDRLNLIDHRDKTP